MYVFPDSSIIGRVNLAGSTQEAILVTDFEVS